MHSRFLVALILAHLLLVAASAMPQFGFGFGRGSPHISVNFKRLQEKTNGAAKISHGPNGGVFLSFPSNQAVPLERLVTNANLLNSANTLPSMSLAFVQEYHSLWGFHSAQQVREQVFVKHTETDIQLAGHSHVIMEQRFGGVRVFGGDLRAHFTKDGKLSAINGLMVNNLNEKTIPSTKPGISAEEASAIAINAVATKIMSKSSDRFSSAQYSSDIKNQLRTKPVSSENLLIFRKDVISLNPKDSTTTRLVWDIEVISLSLAVRDQVMVDAHTGEVANHISLIQHSLNRRVYEGTLSNGTLVWQEGDDLPTSNTEMMHVLNGSKAFYEFFSTAANWTSFDNNDAIINSIYRIQDLDRCPNAWWDGTKISYCTGITALDVAVHELTHAVTSHTDNLYYQFQSGALNEAYSDIFGETVNILTGKDPLTQVLRTTGSCSKNGEGDPANDTSTRWLIGEDISYSYFNQHGLRDMWRPECYGNPGSVNRQKYFCQDYDQGGVHSNSGVINHAYALAVDGGEFGGYSITGIGFNKAVAVWWRAKRHYQSSTTNFADHANALLQSCTDLVGQTVVNVITGVAEETISQNDCDQISNATEAVNMTVNPMSICDFVSFGKNKTDPATCSSGTKDSLIFSEDFNSNPQGWTAQSIDPGQSSVQYYWGYACTFAGKCGMWAPSMALFYCPSKQPLNVLVSPSISITASGNAVLSFKFVSETYFSENGGSVSAFVNGVERKFSDSDFLYNPYNGVIKNAKNQLNNQPVWTGFTGTSTEEFDLNPEEHLFQTRIKINDLQKGDSLQLKWFSAEDLCRGTFGFFITDVAVTMCGVEIDGSSAASVASTIVLNGGAVTALLALIALMTLFLA